MKKHEYYEVGIAGFLGAVTGLFVGHVFDLWLWLCPIIGGAVGFIGYRPREICVVGWHAIRHAIATMHSPQKRRNIVPRWITETLAFALFLLYLVGAIIIALSVLPSAYIALQLAKWDYFVLHSRGIVSDVLIIQGIPVFVGALMLLASAQAFSSKVPLWVLPIAIHGFGRFGLWLTCLMDEPLGTSARKAGDPFSFSFYCFKEMRESAGVWSMLWTVCLLAIFVCSAQIFFAALLPVLFIDFVFMIVITCSCTKRLASMTGATIGTSVGSLFVLFGWSFSPVVLLVSGGIGYAAGPALLMLHEKLFADAKLVTAS